MSDTQDYVLVPAARLEALEGVVEAHWNCECNCGDVRRAVRKAEATPETPPASRLAEMIKEAADEGAMEALDAMVAELIALSGSIYRNPVTRSMYKDAANLVASRAEDVGKRRVEILARRDAS